MINNREMIHKDISIIFKKINNPKSEKEWNNLYKCEENANILCKTLLKNASNKKIVFLEIKSIEQLTEIHDNYFFKVNKKYGINITPSILVLEKINFRNLSKNLENFKIKNVEYFLKNTNSLTNLPNKLKNFYIKINNIFYKDIVKTFIKTINYIPQSVNNIFLNSFLDPRMLDSRYCNNLLKINIKKVGFNILLNDYNKKFSIKNIRFLNKSNKKILDKILYKIK